MASRRDIGKYGKPKNSEPKPTGPRICPSFEAGLWCQFGNRCKLSHARFAAAGAAARVLPDLAGFLPDGETRKRCGFYQSVTGCSKDSHDCKGSHHTLTLYGDDESGRHIPGRARTRPPAVDE